MFTPRSDALPLKKRQMKDRRLIVVDMENVVGGGVETVGAAACARNVVSAALEIGHAEQVIIGTSHFGMFHVHHCWPGARLAIQSGTNGADLALLDVLESERIAERFGRVAIVSGDGIFAGVAAELGAHGVDVTVCSWRRSLSNRLKLAARRTVLLDNCMAHDKETA